MLCFLKCLKHTCLIPSWHAVNPVDLILWSVSATDQPQDEDLEVLQQAAALVVVSHVCSSQVYLVDVG